MRGSLECTTQELTQWNVDRANDRFRKALSYLNVSPSKAGDDTVEVSDIGRLESAILCLSDAVKLLRKNTPPQLSLKV